MDTNLSYLTLLYNHAFHLETSNSAYKYLNFDYQYKGLPLLIAIQKQGPKRLDAFVLNQPASPEAKLDLKARKLNYHQGDIRAVGSVCDSIVTIDDLGEMHILKVPE